MIDDTILRDAIIVLSLAACSKPAETKPDNTRPASTATVTGAKSAAPLEADARPKASATVAPKPARPAKLTWVERFADELGGKGALQPIEGALLVATDPKVGRIDGDRIEWLGRIPEGGIFTGGNRLGELGGRWPDMVYALYTTNHGRIPAPTFWPIKGEARKAVFSSGGGYGSMSGVARLGSTYLVAGYSNNTGERYTVERVSGPIVDRKPQGSEKCPKDEKPSFMAAPPPAVRPWLYGSAEDGTLFSIGALCDDAGMAAEIWPPKGGPSRIVSLNGVVAKKVHGGVIHKGDGDRIWIDLRDGQPLVAYAGGTFTKLPTLPRKRRAVFVTPSKELHASDGRTIWQLEAGAWKKVADLDWSGRIDGMGSDGKRFWASANGRVFRLDPGDGTRFTKRCKTPLVHLYDVNPKLQAKFSFPKTRRALRAFGGKNEIKLVDFKQGERRIGVVVPDEATGKALIAHAKKEMPEDRPVLLCFAPQDAREIEL